MDEVSVSPLSGGSHSSSPFGAKLHRGVSHKTPTRRRIPRRPDGGDAFAGGGGAAADDAGGGSGNRIRRSHRQLHHLPSRADSNISLPALPSHLTSSKRTSTKGSDLSLTSLSSASISSELTDGINSLRNTGSRILKFPYLPPIQVLLNLEEKKNLFTIFEFFFLLLSI